MNGSDAYDELWGDTTPIPESEITPTPSSESEITNTVTPSGEDVVVTNTPTPEEEKEDDKLPELTNEAVKLPSLPPTNQPTPTEAAGVTMAPVDDNVEVITATPTPTPALTIGEEESGLGEEGSAPLDDLNWGPLIPM